MLTRFERVFYFIGNRLSENPSHLSSTSETMFEKQSNCSHSEAMIVVLSTSTEYHANRSMTQ